MKDIQEISTQFDEAKLYSLEAERALLACLISNNDIYDVILDVIKPECFYFKYHGDIFKACGKIIRQGQAAEPVSLQVLLQDNSFYKETNGDEYLKGLFGSFFNIVNYKSYAELIYKYFIKRKLAEIISQASENIKKSENINTIFEEIEQVESKLHSLAFFGNTNNDFQEFEHALENVFEEIKKARESKDGIVGVKTNFEDIDKTFGGLHRSDLIIVAGRPAMGKTALAVNIGYNVASLHKSTNGEEGAGVAIFSLEMSAEQLASRIVSSETSITSHEMRTGRIDKAKLARLVEFQKVYSNLPIYIDDTPGSTITSIRSKARRLQQKKDLGLIIIDYIQLIGADKSYENRVTEVAAVTKGLKAIAKELNVPVIALSQLSRAVEARDDNRPVLSDLRESGSIEQDADIVTFIYREAYYHERKKPKETEDDYAAKLAKWEDTHKMIEKQANLIIAKNRHGAITTINLGFDGEQTKFYNIDKIY